MKDINDENNTLEFKTAADRVPHDYWKTYSSFCNTRGGEVILGIQESFPQNIVHGVGDPYKIQGSLDCEFANPNKVSYNAMVNNPVLLRKYNGKAIVITQIPEVPLARKPVYIKNKPTEVYIRTGEGDRKASNDQLEMMSRNASNTSTDQDLLTGFTTDSLDVDSVISYKEKVSRRYPDRGFSMVSWEQFLDRIGAVELDQKSGKYILKKATLLFFGRINEIHKVYPKFHVDYFRKDPGSTRWSDRVTDDDLTFPKMNLYLFFNLVFEKLMAMTQNSFSLSASQEPTGDRQMATAFREALVNALAHSDYDGPNPVVKITATSDYILFENPGILLVNEEDYIHGGETRPRNERIMSLFRFLGLSERQGQGGAQIFSAAYMNKVRSPEIKTNLEKTELKIWIIDLADSYPALGLNEKRILKYMILNNDTDTFSVPELDKKLTGLSAYQIRKCLGQLISEGLVRKTGNGKNTRYGLNPNTHEKITQQQMRLEQMRNAL